MAVDSLNNYGYTQYYPQYYPQYNPQQQPINFTGGGEPQEEKKGSSALGWIVGLGIVGTGLYFLTKGKFGKNLINKLKGAKNVVSQTTVAQEADKIIKGNRLTGEARKNYFDSLKELFKDFQKQVKGEGAIFDKTKNVGGTSKKVGKSTVFKGKTDAEQKAFIDELKKGVKANKRKGVYTTRAKLAEELAESGEGAIIIDKTKSHAEKIKELQARLKRMKNPKKIAEVNAKIKELQDAKKAASNMYKTATKTPKVLQTTAAKAEQIAQNQLAERVDKLEKLLAKAKKNKASDVTIKSIEDKLYIAKGKLADVTAAAKP